MSPLRSAKSRKSDPCQHAVQHPCVCEPEHSARHTPPPWMTANNKQWIVSSAGLTLAKMDAFDGFDADAAFIVRAVNAHEELIQMLKVFTEQFESSPNKGQVYIGYEAIESARKLIAKAEGK